MLQAYPFIAKLESRKDELDIVIKDMEELYEQESQSHSDIRAYIEDKVIKKEDAVDLMVDREEVNLQSEFQCPTAYRL